MTYVTTAQLSARLGSDLFARLTDRVNGNTADSAVAAQLIAEAEGLLDSYFARRYATPLDLTAAPEVADVVGSRALDVAEYFAWRRSPFTSTVPERVSNAYESAREWLNMIAARELDLPSAALPGPEARDDGPRYQAQPRQFTADKLDGL